MDEGYYFLFILKCIDSFLEQFKLSKLEKLEFYSHNAKLFKKEFDVGNITRKSLVKKYNKLEPEITELLLSDLVDESTELSNLLKIRNTQIKDTVFNILVLKNANCLEIDFENLISSYVHMFINRAFRDKQRLYELVCYGYLSLYLTKLNRESRQSNQ